jgi:hypothetical protein
MRIGSPKSPMRLRIESGSACTLPSQGMRRSIFSSANMSGAQFTVSVWGSEMPGSPKWCSTAGAVQSASLKITIAVISAAAMPIANEPVAACTTAPV